MGLFDALTGDLEEDRQIEEDLYGYAPEEREEILMIRYGRVKEEFPWIDFGDDDMAQEFDDSDCIDSDDEEIDSDDIDDEVDIDEFDIDPDFDSDYD